jgi:hypothetical protein
MESDMTDVQVESAKGQKRRGRKQAAAAEQPDDLINFDKAVAKGKELVAKLKTQDKVVHITEMELGELADRLETKYGDKTLERFAKDIGIGAARLKRCRSVYRAWKGKEAPGAPFAVAKELEAHPLRDEIIRERPNLTKRQARSIMRAHRQAHEDELDWRIKESRRWFAGVVKRAQQAISDGRPALSHIDPAVLRQAIDNKDEALTTLHLGSQAWINLIDIVERAFDDPQDEADVA